MIRDTTRLFRKFYQKRVKATILYATETGRSRNYANIVKDVFGKVFASKVGGAVCVCVLGMCVGSSKVNRSQ